MAIRIIVATAMLFASGGARIVSAEMVALGSEVQVNTAAVREDPQLCSDGSGNFVALWLSHGIVAQRLDSTGAVIGSPILVASDDDSPRMPALCCSQDGAFVAAWEQDRSIFARRFSAAGAAEGPSFEVSTDQLNDKSDPAISCGAGGNVVVTWESQGQDGSSGGIFAQIFGTLRCYNNESTELGPCYAFGAATGACAAAGGAVCLSSDFGPIGNEIAVNTTTDGSQQRPAIARASNENFIIAWEGDLSLFESGIGVQLFDSLGNRVGGNTTIAPSDYAEEVALTPAGSGEFLAVWSARSKIFGQHLSADGSSFGDPFPIVEFERVREPSIARRPAGGFLVSWAAERQDGSRYGVFGRELGADGAIIGHEFRINTHVRRSQRQPQMAIAPNDTALVIWKSFEQDNGSDGIYGQRGGFTTTSLACPSSAAGSCRNVEHGKLVVKEGLIDEKDHLLWQAKGGEASLAEIGSALDGTDFRLCVYDSDGLAIDVKIADGAPFGGTGAWRAKGNTQSYKDRWAILGTHKAKLKASSSPTDDDLSFKISAKGSALALPPASAALLSEPVVVQLHNSANSTCWASSFSASDVEKSTSDHFAAATH